MIIDRSQIEKNIARVKCGGENGTAFLIADQVAVTARHVVLDTDSEVILEFLNISTEIVDVKASIISNDVLDSITVDVVFLKLENPIQGFEHLQFEDREIPFRAKWSTFSYPAVEYTHGLPINGVVDQIKSSYNPYDYDMILRYDGESFNPDGVSGSPVIIDGTVRGIITDDKAGINLLGAISTFNFSMVIESMGISFYCPDHNLSNINLMTNDTILSIKSAVDDNNSGCILVKGLPGSGKTLMAANLSDDDLNAKIIGKYFVDDKNDEYSVQYKSSPVIFGKWLINCISKELYGRLVEEKDYESHKLTEYTIRYMNNLSREASKNNAKYVFILDGFDESYRINSEFLNEIFGLLPTVFKERILFIVFGNNEDIYPDRIKNSMHCNSIIPMLPFTQQQIIDYLREILHKYNPDYETLHELTRKSEGNPLYIHYIVEYINTNVEEDKFDGIHNLPDFNGEIENYYTSIWNSIGGNPKFVKVISLLSRIRGTIRKEILVDMLDEETKLIFEEIFSKLKHLLIVNEEIKIYHTSFSNFVIYMTKHIDVQMQNVISDYCVRNSNNYAVENMIYHLVKGDDTSIKQAIKLCSQEWIDKLAVNNVDPDLILIDAKEVLDKAVDLKVVHEIIRLQLLIQRLKFRNEKVFRQYAFEMAKALFENGKSCDSLNYMIREEALIINLEEALYMLRRFIQENETEYAKELVEAIQKRCIKDYQDNSIPYTTILADISSTALFPEYDLQRRILLFSNMLKEFSPDSYQEIMTHISADISGYAMWDRMYYMNVSQMEENFGELSEDFVYIQLKLIQAYLMFESQFHKKENDTLDVALSDLEGLCRRFEITKDDEIALVLMKFGSDLDLTNNFLNNIDECQFVLRAENGVDLNYKKINEYYNYFMMNSFLSAKLDELEIKSREWESYLKSIIEGIATIEGLCWKARYEKNNDLKNRIIQKLLKLLPEINFRLEVRADWDRSYTIPEELMRFVWIKIAELLTRFDIQSIERLVSFIIENEQLGIYNEGYRRLLFDVADRIINNTSLPFEAFKLIDKLEYITENYVQNRWERTRDYLKIMERYGKIKAFEKAQDVYMKMLDTSMGPSWYKEAQMTLMGTCIKELTLLPDKSSVLVEALSNLDYSSGEMTFQRYVRDEKERFVEIIGDVLGLNTAVEYFKFLTFPIPQDILRNVNYSSMDILKDGYGYVQGTKEIDLQDASLSLIRSFKDVSSELVWGLTEIFIQGDDRYFYEYSGLQLEMLGKAFNSNQVLYDELLVRTERQFVSEFDNTRRSYFLAEFEYWKEIECLESIKNNLLDIKGVDKVEFTRYSRYKDDIGDQSSEEDSDKVLKLVDQEIIMGNKKKAKGILAQELLKVSEQGYSVFNYSALTNQSLKLLKEYTDSPEELVELISSIIKNPYGHLEWIIVNELLKLIGAKLSEDESTSVVNTIMNHFGYLIRTPEFVREKYQWINTDEMDSSDEDSVIFEFILWLSNLPSGLLVEKRVFDVVLWISKYNTNKYVPLLVKNALNTDYPDIVNMCCGILHNLSQTNKVEVVCYCIYYNRGLREKMLESNDFMILSTFYEIFKKAYENGVIGIENLYNDISEKLFSDYKVRNQNETVSIEHEWLKSSEPYIKRLHEIVVFDSDFMDQLFMKVSNKIAPNTLVDILKIERYIERSYSLPSGLSGYYNSIILSGVNKLITKYVTTSNYNKIIELLRPYNPKSPELTLAKYRPNIFDRVKKIFQEKSTTFNHCCEYNGLNILHFHEAIENVETQRFDRLEIVAFLASQFNPTMIYQNRMYDYFSVNVDPNEVELDVNQNSSNVIPLILKSQLAFVYGSMYTPSEIHPYISSLMQYKDKESIHQISWRDGRVLDVHKFGMPISEGSCLLISKDVLAKFKGNNALIYKVTFNEDIFFLDYDNKRVY